MTTLMVNRGVTRPMAAVASTTAVLAVIGETVAAEMALEALTVAVTAVTQALVDTGNESTVTRMTHMAVTSK